MAKIHPSRRFATFMVIPGCSVGLGRALVRAVSRLLGFSIRSLFLVWCHPAYAQQDNIYLDYVAAIGCPSRSEFVAQVKARTALAQFVDVASDDRRFAVSARFEGGRAVGRFTSGRGATLGTARQVTSERCEDVVSALALIAALAIDPRANVAQTLPPSGSSAPSASAMPSNAASNTDANQQVKRPAPSGSSSPILANPPASVESTSGTAVRHSSWQLGLLANGTIWVSSPLMPVGGLSAMVEWQSLGEQSLAPAVRLLLARAVSATVQPDTGGGARFTLSTAELDFCALRINLGSSVALRPCLGIDGGWITATGVRRDPVVDTQERTRPWWGVHETLRMQVELGKGSYGLEAGLSEPLWRDAFVFNYPAPTPGSAPYQMEIIHVPVWAPLLGAGVARRFW